MNINFRNIIKAKEQIGEIFDEQAMRLKNESDKAARFAFENANLHLKIEKMKRAVVFLISVLICLAVYVSVLKVAVK